MTHVRYLTKSSVCSHLNTSASRFDPGAMVALCANNTLIFLWCHKRLHSKLTVNRVSTISGQYLPSQIKHSGDFLVWHSQSHNSPHEWIYSCQVRHSRFFMWATDVSLLQKMDRTLLRVLGPSLRKAWRKLGVIYDWRSTPQPNK